MKKNYIKPEVDVMLAHGENMLAVSGVAGKIDDSVDIGYGGVDEEGTQEADVRANSFGESIFD